MKLFPKSLLVLIIYTVYVGDTQADDVNVFRLLLPLYLIHSSECLLKIFDGCRVHDGRSSSSQLSFSRSSLRLHSLCLSLSVRVSVLRSWWSAGSGPGAWTLPCGPLTPPSSSLWAAACSPAEPCTSSSGWVRHGRSTNIMFVMVSCIQWLFSLRSLISHVAMNHLSVNFPHVLCSIWGVWVIWDALRGTAARVPRVASAWFLLCWCDSLSAPRLSKQKGFSLSTAHRTNTRHKASPLPLFLFHSPALKRVETAVHRPAEDPLAEQYFNHWNALY